MAKKILVVDDEQDVRDYLSSYLEDQGYDCRAAQDGLVAMEMVQQEPPDLILLDLQMPEETGTGLYRKLHHKKDLREIPVIVISGLAGRDVAVGKSVPVFDKPIDKEALLARIREVLS
jgi:DNA-binding response OmpR family regulator